MTKNTKTLLWVAGLGAVAYYFWMKKKQAKVVAPSTSAPSTTQFTGNQGVFDYQNAAGVPKFGKQGMYPSSQNTLGSRLSGF